MDLQTLAQKTSDATRLSKNDIQLIMNKAFIILVDSIGADKQALLTIENNNKELNLLISKI